ncbi:hypothetical protein BN77_p10692 [Rhizobium mesoamericanum STM3625]|uniref:Uncharacterized protein n=1 Tax=Rhizobium mesoamericanum STM3625 TaxID=1211777 RepID=K0Q4G5_9HYPH|nr:hypothetical protein BN77_p10692 [Rhizobium mesoamericanum STM3625]
MAELLKSKGAISGAQIESPEQVAFAHAVDDLGEHRRHTDLALIVMTRDRAATRSSASGCSLEGLRQTRLPENAPRIRGRKARIFKQRYDGLGVLAALAIGSVACLYQPPSFARLTCV